MTTMRITVLCMCIMISAAMFGGLSGCGSSNANAPTPDGSTETADPAPVPAPVPHTGPYYWISTAGSDDNPGTEELPFLTVGKAASQLEPKDIYVLPGNYPETESVILRHGVGLYGMGVQTSDPSTNKTIIDFSECPTNCMLYIEGAAPETETTIDGMTIIGKSVGIFAMEAAPTISRTEVTTVEGDFQVGIEIQIGSTNKVYAPVIEQCKITTGSATGTFGYTRGIRVFGSRMALSLIGNEISSGSASMGSIGVEIYGEDPYQALDVTMTDNIIRPGDAGQQSYGILLSETKNAVIERNRIAAGNIVGVPDIDANRAIGISAENVNVPDATLTLANNVIFGGNGAHVSTALYCTGVALAVDLSFNTMVNGVDTQDYSPVVSFFNLQSSAMRNNIICSMHDGDYAVSTRPALMNTFTNNLFCDGFDHLLLWVSAGYDTIAQVEALSMSYQDNIEGDPMFANPDVLDFTLTAGSDAIDAGAAIGGIVTDITGGDRLKGVGTDIGAYEYPSS